jgi:hypothetical protein
MCWNKEVSLFSFVIIGLISYKFYKRNLGNDRLLAFFILSYGSMQLFEFFIWLGIDTNKSYLNFIGSILACILLYLHPLAILLGMYHDKLYTKYKSNTYYNILLLSSIILVVFGVYNIILHLNKKNKTYNFLSYPDKINNHLVWDFPSHYYVIILISLLITVFPFIENKLFWLSIILYYFLPAIFIYFTNKVATKNKNKNYIGSYWCWWVAIFSFVLYFLNPKIQKK